MRNDAANRPGGITNRGQEKSGRIVDAAEMIDEFRALPQKVGV
jgi:hypothetical protein